jgi:hypothetical protein
VAVGHDTSRGDRRITSSRVASTNVTTGVYSEVKNSFWKGLTFSFDPNFCPTYESCVLIIPLRRSVTKKKMNDIKMDPRNVSCEDRRWIELAQIRDGVIWYSGVEFSSCAHRKLVSILENKLHL